MGAWFSYELAMMIHSDSAVLYGDCGYLMNILIMMPFSEISFFLSEN